MASFKDMAPCECTRTPPTCSLGKSGVTDVMIHDMEIRGVLEVGFARAPSAGQTTMRPRSDEVVVFRDFFATGLRFSLDPVVVEIFKLHKVFLHQMMLTSFLQLNLYMWLAKTRLPLPLPDEDYVRVDRR